MVYAEPMSNAKTIHCWSLMARHLRCWLKYYFGILLCQLCCNCNHYKLPMQTKAPYNQSINGFTTKFICIHSKQHLISKIFIEILCKFCLKEKKNRNEIKLNYEVDNECCYSYSQATCYMLLQQLLFHKRVYECIKWNEMWSAFRKII